MKLQEDYARAQPHLVDMRHDAGDEQVRPWDAFPGTGKVFADPGFTVSQGISADQ
jgi:hypothetical protein